MIRIIPFRKMILILALYLLSSLSLVSSNILDLQFKLLYRQTDSDQSSSNPENPDILEPNNINNDSMNEERSPNSDSSSYPASQQSSEQSSFPLNPQFCKLKTYSIYASFLCPGYISLVSLKDLLHINQDSAKTFFAVRISNVVDSSLSDNMLCFITSNYLYFRHLDRFKSQTSMWNYTLAMFSVPVKWVRNVRFLLSENLVLLLGDTENKLMIMLFIEDALNFRYNIKSLEKYIDKETLQLQGAVVAVSLTLNRQRGIFQLVIVAQHGIAFYDISVDENEIQLNYRKTYTNDRLFLTPHQRIVAARFHDGSSGNNILALQADFDGILLFRLLDDDEDFGVLEQTGKSNNNGDNNDNNAAISSDQQQQQQQQAKNNNNNNNHQKSNNNNLNSKKGLQYIDQVALPPLFYNSQSYYYGSTSNQLSFQLMGEHDGRVVLVVADPLQNELLFYAIYQYNEAFLRPKVVFLYKYKTFESQHLAGFGVDMHAFSKNFIGSDGMLATHRMLYVGHGDYMNSSFVFAPICLPLEYKVTSLQYQQYTNQQQQNHDIFSSSSNEKTGTNTKNNQEPMKIVYEGCKPCFFNQFTDQINAPSCQKSLDENLDKILSRASIFQLAHRIGEKKCENLALVGPHCQPCSQYLQQLTERSDKYQDFNETYVVPVFTVHTNFTNTQIQLANYSVCALHCRDPDHYLSFDNKVCIPKNQSIMYLNFCAQKTDCYNCSAHPFCMWNKTSRTCFKRFVFEQDANMGQSVQQNLSNSIDDTLRLYKKYYDCCQKPKYCNDNNQFLMGTQGTIRFKPSTNEDIQNRENLLLDLPNSEEILYDEDDIILVQKNEVCSWYIDTNNEQDYQINMTIGQNFAMLNDYVKVNFSICLNSKQNHMQIPCEMYNLQQNLTNDESKYYRLNVAQFRINIQFRETTYIKPNQFSIQFKSIKEIIEEQQKAILIHLLIVISVIIFVTLVFLMLKNRLFRYLRLRFGIELFIHLEDNVPLSEGQTDMTIDRLIRTKKIQKKKVKDIQFQFEQNECSFCLEGYEPDQDAALLFCKHVFHFSCIQNWIKMERRVLKCPICKRQLSNQQPEVDN